MLGYVLEKIMLKRRSVDHKSWAVIEMGDLLDTLLKLQLILSALEDLDRDTDDTSAER